MKNKPTKNYRVVVLKDLVLITTIQPYYEHMVVAAINRKDAITKAAESGKVICCQLNQNLKTDSNSIKEVNKYESII